VLICKGVCVCVCVCMCMCVCMCVCVCVCVCEGERRNVYMYAHHHNAIIVRCDSVCLVQPRESSTMMKNVIQLCLLMALVVMQRSPRLPKWALQYPIQENKAHIQMPNLREWAFVVVPELENNLNLQ